MLPCQADEVTDSYLWFKDGRDITADSSFIVQAGLGLSVSSASKNDSGMYTCVAMNEMGTANASAEVHITTAVITCEGKHYILVWKTIHICVCDQRWSLVYIFSWEWLLNMYSSF